MTTADELRQRLGRFGIFAGPPARLGLDPVKLARAAEDAGFTSAWIGGGNTTPDDFEVIAAMLGATSRLVLATGIANVWAWSAADLEATAASVERRFPGRFILGLGVSHAGLVEALGHAYDKPFSKMVSFLDELGSPGVPVVLAALGPKMVKLSGERTLGSHPYFTVPAHTAQARSILGPGPLLVPEVAGSLAPGDEGLAAVRPYARHYLRLPNYVASIRRLGFTEADVAGDGSDALLAAVAPRGAQALVAAARAHLEAGADHVVVQPLAAGGGFSINDLPAVGAALAG